MIKMRRKYIPIVLILLITLTIFGEIASYGEEISKVSSTKKLYVGGSGEENYSKIQDTIDDAINGDTIFVYSGVYYENIVIDKKLSIIGESKESTVIDGGKNESVVEIISDYVLLKNLTIQRSGGRMPSAGIKIHSAHNEILNCIVTKNFDGISLERSSYNLISNCSIYSNNDAGIWLHIGSKYNKISHCRIYSNGYYGIWIQSSNRYNSISNCSIYENGGGISICCSSDSNKISYCTIRENRGEGIKISNSNDNKIFLNNFIENKKKTCDKKINYWDNGEYGNYWSDFDEPDEGAYDNDSNGIIDMPYSISCGDNKDNYPLTKKVEIGINKIPNVIILTPSNNSTVSGKIVITGNANDSDGSVKKVEIKIGNSTWIKVNGTHSWNYEFDTKEIPNGEYFVMARAYDGHEYSRVYSVKINVDNKKDKERTPGFEIFLIFMSILTAYMMSKKHHKI
ncbi:MAG TPA: hypothetical protein ENI52_02870 [Thermoplasmata archaeon]|nr:hypothetical protein [Thermoplasmata archaeon]